MEFINNIKNYVLSNIVILIIILLFIVLNDVIIMNFGFNNKQPINNITYDKEVLVKKENLPSSLIKVDIKGYVNKPGVYEINAGTNVSELIEIAGGLKKGATTDNINLSKVLSDQMVVFISKKSTSKVNNTFSDSKSTDTVKEVIVQNSLNDVKVDNYVGEPIYIDNASNSNSNTNLISLNNASKDELLTLAGIGESKADAIIKYRIETPFKAIEDIMNVSGIGEALFAKIKYSITI